MFDWNALRTDAEAYWHRNVGQHYPQHDPIEPALDRIHRHSPITAALEVGASDGWRLERIKARYGCRVEGLEASSSAIKQARLPLHYGLAPAAIEDLRPDSFDLVILGFFAYLLPRSSMLHLAAAVDTVLQPGGHLVIIDFLSPYPTRSNYAHHPKLAVWKQDLAQLWTGSPQWVLTERTLIEHEAHDVDNAEPARWITVDVIRKLPEHHAWDDVDQVRSRTA